MSQSDENLIQIGDKVILRKGNNIQVAKVQKNTKCNLDKMWFQIDGAIGQPYGTFFEVKGKKIEPVEDDSNIMQDFADRIEQGKDNRNIVDDSASQKLSREQIEEMRKQGEKGQDVVRQLVENSSSFKDKTEFSQEKYIRKKNKKHLNRFKIIRPNTRLIAEMYFNKGPARINFLRMDALAQMLTYGNVRAGTRQLVVESCNGLLLAATLERMADNSESPSKGVLVQLHQEQDPPRQALESYPFQPEQLSLLRHLPLKFLGKVKSLKNDDASGEKNNETDLETCPTPVKKPRLEDTVNEKTEVKDEPKSEDPLQMEQTASLDNNGSSSNSAKPCQDDAENQTNEEKIKLESEKMLQDVPAREHHKGISDPAITGGESQAKTVIREAQELKRLARQKKIDETLEILREGGFDSLLIAARVHPTPIAVRLLECLKESSPVCIFSPYKEPLVDCYQRLRDTNQVVHLRLSETWLRNYQVLPNRTHPEINMSTNGGYLLTFIKVSSQPPTPFTSC